MLMRPTALQLAVIEAKLLLERNHWIVISATPNGEVKLEWGVIHTDGTHERAIADRTYSQQQDFVNVSPVRAHA